jgi:hypothetical protein
MKIRPATPDDFPLTSSRRDAYGSVFPDEYLRNRVRDDLADQWRGHATAFLWVFSVGVREELAGRAFL